MRIEATNGGMNYNHVQQTQSQKNDVESKEHVVNGVKQENVQDEIRRIEAEKEQSENDPNQRKENETEKEVIRAIEEANKHIRTYERRLEFSIHDVTKEIMVKVINTEDDSIIREIPSEKVLDMVGKMWEVAGLLVDERR